MNDMLTGELVYLAPDNPEVRAAKFYSWNQDTEWNRLLDTDPPRLLSEKKWKEWLEKDLEKGDSNDIFFSIHPLGSDTMIGFVGLFDVFMNHGDALVAIALGERENWGKGYGTDAMRILLRVAAYFLLHADMGLSAAQVGAAFALGRLDSGAAAP